MTTVLQNKNNPPLNKEGLEGIKSNKGLTLVEVLIAMVVLLFVSLAMMQTALVSIDSNMINVLRDEAVNIAEERMSEARNTPFASLASDPAVTMVTLSACGTAPISDPNYPVRIDRNFRNITSFTYGSRMTVNPIGPEKEVTILVRWDYRGRCYTHGISTVIKRETS